MTSYKEYAGISVADFSSSPNRLEQLNYSQLQDIAKIEDNAFYLLDLDKVTLNYHTLRTSFTPLYESCQVAYSFKTNYTPALCKHLKELGCFAEVVSQMEYEIATKEVGYPPSQVIVNGPVHNLQFVEAVLLDGACFNVDAWYLLDMVKSICERYGERQFKIGIRLSYPIAEGGYSRFGIESDEANFDKLRQWQNTVKNCDIIGFHSHYSNSSRSLSSFESRIKGLAKASWTFFEHRYPNFINVGGGFFGQMPTSLAAQYENGTVSIEQYAEVICSVMNTQYPPSQSSTPPLLLLEPGTALVANCMVFVAPVLEVKKCGGRTLVLINGSNHNVNHKWQGETLPIQIIRCPNNGPLNDVNEVFDIVGNTCIEKDVICTDVQGGVQAGDFIVFQYMGGYSNVLKQPFIHPCQGIYAWQQQTLIQIKKSGDMRSVLYDYQ
ncbi:Diaminopimelate decarboxylase [Pseudoalteromonas sp. CIP111854]|uniref:Diaminopimelate decarboxylase n=1 Tax=Pseudoalteromonas holothuriae TaxID=2963714 RepID=A0A9W4QR11_9GAMM|nr:hypothetical protein [Pseudoalteromonas sp. CIP111854]CAH9049551.1 Diaminopimelate decarboxylase [Pseudoalteromonas sp. CIP111854]